MTTRHELELEQRAEQIEKLPVWARTLIQGLHNDLTSLRQSFAEVNGVFDNVTTVAEPNADYPRAIGENPAVQHTFTDLPGHRVDVAFFADRLEIHESGSSSGRLAVSPKSGNAIEVRSVRRDW